MKAQWNLYHPQIPSFLPALAATPPLQRLRKVGMHCGCEYTAVPSFSSWLPYSRFDHSVGVALIIYHFTGNTAQAVSGLLHDVATPVFAHVVDFLLGDHLRQSATEGRTAELIAASSPLMAALKSLDLTLEDVADYHRYPIADNDSPRLSADRLEYTLGNLLSYGFADQDQICRLYGDLTVGLAEDGGEELSFLHAPQAASFGRLALSTGRVYVAPEDRFAMETLARLLKAALQRGILTPADLWTTEPEVIAKLTADPSCRALWQYYTGLFRVRTLSSSSGTGALQVRAKLRYIDPLLQGRGRLSQWDDAFSREVATFRSLDFSDFLEGESKFPLH